MKNNLISIIIPIYNVEKYLAQCLDSIIHQTYKNLEIILIDDWSTDNSWKICDEYSKKDERIKVFHTKNWGLSTARNIWLKHSNGEYIWYIDSDDFIATDMYEILYKAAIESDSDITICNRHIWDQYNNWTENKKFPKETFVSTDEALDNFYKSMYVWNKLYKKNLIKDISFVEMLAQDVLYNFTLFKKAKRICCINKCGYYYRHNPTSRQHTRKFKKEWFKFLNVLDMEILYAKGNKLHKLEKKLIWAKVDIIVTRLTYIALDNEPDLESTDKLLQYVKEHKYIYLKSETSFRKKCFTLLFCINFKLASNIYRKIDKFIS